MNWYEGECLIENGLIYAEALMHPRIGVLCKWDSTYEVHSNFFKHVNEGLSVKNMDITVLSQQAPC